MYFSITNIFCNTICDLDRIYAVPKCCECPCKFTPLFNFIEKLYRTTAQISQFWSVMETVRGIVMASPLFGRHFINIGQSDEG